MAHSFVLQRALWMAALGCLLTVAGLLQAPASGLSSAAGRSILHRPADGAHGASTAEPLYAALKTKRSKTAKANARQRHHFRAQQATNDDSTGNLPIDTFTSSSGVKVYHFTFPGTVEQTMYIRDDVLVALSNGNLYATRHHGQSWECWTCGTNFGGVLTSKVQGFWSQTDALSTESLEKSIRDLFNTQICVVTNEATYMISTLTAATRGRPSELLIADSAALRQFPQLRPGRVRFDALEFHPTKPNERAFAFLRDPSCDPFRSACRNFAFVSTNLKDFFLVPAFEPFLLMWENPVGARQVNYSVPWVQRSRNAFDGKAYSPSDFFMVLSDSLDSPFGRLVRLPLDGVDWASVTKDALAARTQVIAVDVADARAIVGHEFAGGFDKTQGSAFFATSTDNFKTLVRLEFPKHIFAHGTPSEDGPETGYTVIDEREDVFVNVYRGTTLMRQLWGHTYQSGLRGLRYTISLPYTRIAPPGRESASGSVDFHRVRGLDGVLVANRIGNPQDASCRRCGSQRCAESCRVETVLSRDNGKTWQRLRTMPTNGGDSNVELPDSNPLNLHGLTSSWNTPSILSSRHAPGFIIGNGNEGDSLNQGDNVESSVYVSRNAGRTWRQIARGPHLYGEGDLGALVYLLPAGSTAGTRGAHLNFSMDGGQTFQSTPILKPDDNTDIDMRYIGRPVHDPLSLFAMVVGLDGHGRVHVMRVDFRGVSDRDHCQGLDTPDDPSSDFETFTPQAHDGQGCLMGRKTTYVRKKYGKNCWIEPPKTRTTIDYSLPHTPPVNCACTFDDYECDFGFEQQADTTCTATDETPTPDKICAAARNNEAWAKLYTDGNGNYAPTKGYRRIAGDSCQGSIQSEVEPSTAWLPCPAPPPKAKPKSKLVPLLIVALLVAAVAILYRVNPKVRDAVDDTVDAARPVVAKGVDKVKSWFAPTQRYGALSTHEDAAGNDTDVVDHPSETPRAAASANEGQQLEPVGPTRSIDSTDDV